MPNITSPADKIANALAPSIRKITDRFISVKGTGVEVLRIETTQDIRGDINETYDSHLISNVVIAYPSEEFRLFSTIDDLSKQLNTKSMDIWDILPIDMFIQFEGAYDTEPVALNEDDLIVDVKQDEHGNKLPIILQVKSLKGTFKMKYIVRKKYEVVLYRGILPSAIKTIVQDYIDNQ
jgi:hypothetical protein